VIFLKKAFIISGVFISGLIGAGFASGSEILFYFSRYSKMGLWGILLCVLIFSFVQYMTISRSHSLKTFTIDDYFSKIMNKPFFMISSIISYIFMIVIFCAMLSGSGELLSSVLGINNIYGALIMLVSTHLILLKGYKGFVSAQSFLSIIIVVSIFLFGAYIIFFREQTVGVFKPDIEWGVSAISYAGYNLLTAIAILCIISKDSDAKTTAKASLITFLMLLPILTILWFIICIYNGMINLGAMPLLTIAMRQSAFVGYLYCITIFISMLTTAVSNCYALILRLSDFTDKKTAHYLVMASAFLLSGFKFEFIVDKLYRCVGILSVFILFYIAKDFIKNYQKN